MKKIKRDYSLRKFRKDTDVRNCRITLTFISYYWTTTYIFVRNNFKKNDWDRVTSIMKVLRLISDLQHPSENTCYFCLRVHSDSFRPIREHSRSPNHTYKFPRATWDRGRFVDQKNIKEEKRETLGFCSTFKTSI